MPKRVLLDTNLLVLFIVGGTDLAYIGKHKNCTNRKYTEEDYNAILSLALASSGVVTTPQILSETSNLLRQTSEPIKQEVTALLRLYIKEKDEIYIHSSTSADDNFYSILGFSDVSILSAMDENTVLVTDDGPLHSAACSRSLQAIHLEEIRTTVRQ